MALPRLQAGSSSEVAPARKAPEAKHDEALAQVVLSEGQRMASEQNHA